MEVVPSYKVELRSSNHESWLVNKMCRKLGCHSMFCTVPTSETEYGTCLGTSCARARNPQSWLIIRNAYVENVLITKK